MSVVASEARGRDNLAPPPTMPPGRPIGVGVEYMVSSSDP